MYTISRTDNGKFLCNGEAYWTPDHQEAMQFETLKEAQESAFQESWKHHDINIWFNYDQSDEKLVETVKWK